MLKSTPIVALILSTLGFSLAAPAIAQSPTLPVTSPLIAQTASQEFIGLQYRNVPSGLENLGGWMLNSTSPEYAVARVRQGDREMLWLEVLIERNAEGYPLFEVLDVLELPTLADDETLGHRIFSCTQAEKDDEYNAQLIAIVLYEPEQEYLTQVRRAWRANWQTGQFEEVEAEGIVCLNPSWGV